MNEFERRLGARRDELKWLYRELYDEAAYEYFEDMLRRAYDGRSEELRALDRRRERRPDWYKSRKMLGMQLYVKAFGGNLRGVRDRLGYLEECGVNYLHLMPLLESPEGKSDGGYAVSDFRRIQPELGTMEDLAGLSAECHRRGISVCLDFVMNHTSDEHEWARRARAGEREYQDRYFFYNSWDIPNEFEKTVPQVFPTTAPGNFTWSGEAGKVVMTCFYPFQWDLNYRNSVVMNDMTDNMLYLANQGVDVIRLDAVPYIWKELGTSCRNLPRVHTLVRIMRLACEIVCPGTLLLGEVVMEPSRVLPYFGTPEKPECHMLYNVTTMATIWHTVATRDTRLLKRQLEAVFAIPPEYGFLNYLRCHDDMGWGLDYPWLSRFGTEEVAHKRYLNDWFTGKYPGSPARGELYNDDPTLGDARLCGTTASLCGMETDPEAAIRLDLTLHALILTLSGLPIIYSGDEIGRLNDYGYRDDPIKREDSRWIHRGDMDWAAAERRAGRGTTEHKLFTGLRRLERLRAKSPVFDADAAVRLAETGSDAVLGIERGKNGKRLTAYFNFSGDEKKTGETVIPPFGHIFISE